MLDYVVDAAVVYIPIKMYKAVSEPGHICQALGKRGVYEVCLSQIPETVAVIFGNSFQFPGRNMKTDIQGCFYGRQQPGPGNILAVLVCEKSVSAKGPESLQSLQRFVNILNIGWVSETSKSLFLFNLTLKKGLFRALQTTFVTKTGAFST